MLVVPAHIIDGNLKRDNKGRLEGRGYLANGSSPHPVNQGLMFSHKVKHIHADKRTLTHESLLIENKVLTMNAKPNTELSPPIKDPFITGFTSNQEHVSF